MIRTFLLITIATATTFISANSQPKFTAETIDATVQIGYGIAIGDVDGDGKPDILLADKKQFVWYRNGDWKRFVMAENLTEYDNVCIAARDINGDGKVEVAVGAQWNPGETSDDAKSGAVYYLIRPEEPTQLWKAVKLYHEPTIHRMQWVKWPGEKFSLVVAPLHGRGNKNGEGAGARLMNYRMPADVSAAWPVATLDSTMHMTHNFFTVEAADRTTIYLAGKEGVSIIDGNMAAIQQWPDMIRGAGEIQVAAAGDVVAAIEPMHGNELAAYLDNQTQRVLLDSSLREGHALAVADVLNTGSSQVIAGWRGANSQGKVGIKLYARQKDNQWQPYWIDENGMACEDLKVADLNADGKPDIIASGRATHNLKIYWNGK
ncbi:FG-GAP and VCBS repeat-containing protein [Foetidibacter luteolus]|uniref:FG-GAP and VCBS repeat-containing protein n=1 Tax=Foetidibacter luteolus TaxID=2608880 RepID=UPI00129AD01B|nr:FG-GAP and VCBS repeat-containing protein [Foetidibacter luteolus]